MSRYADHFEKRECNKDITRVRRIIEKIVFLRGLGRKFCANVVTYKNWCNKWFCRVGMAEFMSLSPCV